jgi:antitoxin component YwqK of YwqJK toxin-antitoxin module
MTLKNRKGEIHGKWVYYWDIHGKRKKEQGYYLNGVPYGEFKGYHENGKPAYQFHFGKKGEPIKIWRAWDEKGNIIAEEVWQDGDCISEFQVSPWPDNYSF